MISGIAFFKTRARQLFRAMFILHDLHWIAAVLNPRTRMLKLATDAERTHAHALVRFEITQIMAMTQPDDSRAAESQGIASHSQSPYKKFKSYTTQFDDDYDNGDLNKEVPNSTRARRELDAYLQLKLSKCTSLKEDNDNPLLFWKEQQHLLPNMAVLAKKIFCIPASSAAVERAFSSAGVVVSQRRSNINPSTVNDIILVRSGEAYSKRQLRSIPQKTL